MDWDLEWGTEMDASLAWRLGYEPFRKARPPSLDNVGMGVRYAAYNAPPQPESKMIEELKREMLEVEYQTAKRLAQEKFGRFYSAYAEAFGLRGTITKK